MRKYLLNIGVISAAFGAVGLIRATASGPRNWRLALLWFSWLISLALAIGTVAEDNPRIERD
ncbi:MULTISPECIES: hypothetical protein [Mycetocola]|uniref:Uncharacterized protein n=1 Tax=Mycetocola lacteus TaxID=76637 RepID=A0A3L7AVB5_9MICO|nr:MULTISPECIES: hypothetical protein [Mycetocola]MCS4275622.1 hypothetical protein [Mycetocola sp. BIGb0189]RLP80688.1 hypothetical protein D9V34_12510 [Mycetocola lacteus]RLP84473.1 hypothetical protein D9V34_00215 [Mycetocola lacteus]